MVLRNRRYAETDLSGEAIAETDLSGEAIA